MKPVVIAVAITGSVPRKSDNPAVPVTPAEQVESTHAVFEAGASLAHIHVRNPDESSSSDPAPFAPAPPRQPGQMGRPRLKGKRLPGFKAVLADSDTVWSWVTVPEWYGGRPRELEVASNTAV